MKEWLKRAARVLAVLAVVLVAAVAFSPKAYAANKGWTKQDGAWYYYENNGTMRRNNWASYAGTWYYFGSDGKLVVNGWAEYQGTRYYIGSNGKVATKTWAKYGEGYVYVGADGKITTDSWIKYGNTYYYLGSDGFVATDEWIPYAGKTYYMGPDGKPLINTTATIGDTVYYFDATAACVMSRPVDGPLVTNLEEWVSEMGDHYVVPFININSADVDKINADFEAFNASIHEWSEYYAAHQDEYYYYAYIPLLANWDAYVSNNILTLKSWANYELNMWRDFGMVSVDLNTGKRVTNTDFLKAFGISESAFKTFLTNYYKSEFPEWRDSFEPMRDWYIEQYTKQYSDATINDYSVLYLNTDGSLYVMTRVYSLAGPEYAWRFIPVNI